MAQEPQFAISLMCVNFLDLQSQLGVLDRRAQLYHVDIMDGHFAPNLALSPDFMRAIRGAVSLPMEAHLMTENPLPWIDAAAEAGASIISPHAETIARSAFRTLGHIQAVGCQVGVALTPATPLSMVESYLDRIDMLTIMTVDVGYAGQPFIEGMLRKIEQAREMKEREGYRYRIQVDGACNKQTFGRLWGAGAEVFVMGSSGLFGLDDDVGAAYDAMLDDFQRATGLRKAP